MASNALGKIQRVPKASDRARQSGELREANRHMHQFLALLQRELCGPLAAIHDVLFILGQQGNDAAKQRLAEGVMKRQALFIGRLVKDLLEISYSEHGKIPLDRQFQDLAQIVIRAIHKVTSFDEGRQGEVKLLPEAADRNMSASPFEQARTNILNNAAKFAEPGGRVWVTVEVQGGDVVLRIRDNGASAESDMVPQIFDSYWQVEHTFDQSQGGIGIGVAMLRQLAEMQGGSASAHRVGSGRGSEFVVRLPARAEVLENFG